MLVGSFDRAEALELTARHFGPLPRAPRGIPPVVTREPRQEGERRFVVRRAGEVGWVGVSWRAPEAAHADTHALAVLADALAGGVTSRLYQRLVETGMCLDVQAAAWQLRDPGLFQVFATLNPPAPHEKVERIIRKEVASIVRKGLVEGRAGAGQGPGGGADGVPPRLPGPGGGGARRGDLLGGLALLPRLPGPHPGGRARRRAAGDW